jgi:3-methyladenine DNA glycosylase/8-oxoguanine DNA glycosylase
MKKQQPQRNRPPMFTATDPAVFETLASVILQAPVNTKATPKNNTPPEIKSLVRKLNRGR